MAIVYKSLIANFVNGVCVGKQMLPERFSDMQEAITVALDNRLNDLSVIEVRQFQVESEQVVGVTTVYRNVEGIINALKKEYEVAFPGDLFEGSMSSLLGYIKDGMFGDWDYLRDPVSMLSDNEVNALLNEYGEDGFVKCVGKKLVYADVQEAS